MSRTVLITGATQGIGLTLATRLANQGFHVIGLARNAPTKKFIGELILADLSDEKVCQAKFQEINKKFDVDSIVNNVGVAIPGNIGAISKADFNYMVNLNLFSAIQSTQIFMAKMINKRWGRIVNIASRALLGLKTAVSMRPLKLRS